MDNNPKEPARVDLDSVRIDPAWALRVPSAIAMRRLALPLCVIDGSLAVAMADPRDSAAIEAIGRATDKPVSPLAADPAQLRAWLLRVYGDGRASAVQSAPQPTAGADPVALVDGLLRAAALRRASDIHLDPQRGDARVRLRVDGQLEDCLGIPGAALPAVCSRIKVMGGLDIAEKRAPQDGAFTWRLPGSDLPPFDVRVATLPVRFGERITLRMLETGGERLTIDDLGMDPAHRAIFEKLLESPHGLVLLTGPTGSGKTTTLASMLNFINENRAVHIITIEDPIEYYHTHKKSIVTQREIGADVPTFSEALRRALRQDPDVILVGEMRDLETMAAAITAAETGHLVFATLHTTGATTTIDRIIDAFPTDQQEQVRTQLSVGLVAVISQLLLKRVDKPGRVAAFEIMFSTPSIRSRIRDNKTFMIDSDIQTGSKFGMISLDTHLLNLYQAGIIGYDDLITKSKDPDTLVEKLKELQGGR